MLGNGSSKRTTKINLGSDIGKIDAKVFIFLLLYFPFETFWAVPVLPPTSYPGILAKPAVPSLVDTTFLKVEFIFFEIPLLISCIFFYLLFFYL